jgi:poly(3-hydroxybutyrate) depolymerase
MQKKLVILIFCFSLACGINAQSINLHGTVSNKSGKPINGAILTLSAQKIKDTTGTDGVYSLTKIVTSTLPLLIPQYTSAILQNDALVFSLTEPSDIKIQAFDISGTLLKKVLLSNITTGFYSYKLSEITPSNKLFIIKISINNTEMTFRFHPLANGKYTLQSATKSSDVIANQMLAKINAVNDTLKITATGYKDKAITINAYEQKLDITLDSSNSKDPGPSIGCGKTLGSINKSGTYTITTSGKNRTYMVRFPSNYDKTNPYRLIFGMHCMGASAQDIYGNNARSDGAYNFYRLGSLATNAILVAPQGPNSNGTWGGQEDHKFFEDLLDLLKDTLCIDTARVFSVGFSYGAMFTYSLSLNHQDQLRAVVCFAPYDGVIWLPTNSHKPIAFMQTTGMSDNTCGWSGAKGCATKHAQDNGCDNPTTIPTSSGQYLVHDFQGCNEGYPVKVVTFGGGHTAGESWMPQMAWDFLKQF